jgi:uncharacterized protein YjbI with pentapeptide repeats
MENQEYLEILRKGVDVWNQRRSENPDEEIILDRVELSGVNLAKANLSKVYLAESNLSGVDLSEAWLGGINLGGSKLMEANLMDKSIRHRTNSVVAIALQKSIFENA